MKHIIIAGSARSGKTTLAAMLKERFPVYNLFHGDCIREWLISLYGKKRASQIVHSDGHANAMLQLVNAILKDTKQVYIIEWSRLYPSNERLADTIEKIHEKSPDKGYRRLNDDLRHDHGIHVNDKRVLRICRARDIRSTVKYNNRGCTRQAKNPQYLAGNLLGRQFYATKPNEKWLTDVTEFKWYEGAKVHRLYLSAILDLCDRRIVSYALSEHNDNPLLFKTFDKAIGANPNAHPLFHSDRGFQYTSRTFHHKLIQAGMTQSMSRVAHCIDNGPMESFWDILKRERYYDKRFTGKRSIV